jgi:putative CocE/NonD family hydrolase
MAERFEVETEADVAIAMPDGALLLADVYHPAGAGDCPTILTRCPYGRALFAAAARTYAAHGYHVVLQDCRGTAPSKGEPSIFAEASDGRAAGDWIARQPWFDGRLGADGASYLGFTALAFAATRPPYLKALSLQVFGAERHAAWFPGGSFALDLALAWSQIRVATRDGGLDLSDLAKLASSMKEMAERLERAFLHLPLGEADRVATGETLPWFQDWLAHAEVGDPFWKPLDFREVLIELRLPTLLVDGWYDYQVPHMLDDYRRLRAAGVITRLMVGPWTHPTLDPAIVQPEVLAWFDTHLKGKPAPRREGAVRVFVLPDVGWRELPDWPPHAAPRRWWLQPEGRLASEPPPASAPDAYRYDPADPTPAFGGTSLRMAPHSGPVDNRALEARADVCGYTSEPLAEALEILGPVAAELFVRSSTPHADFFVRLCDVHPDGRSLNVCDGLLRLRPGEPAPAPDGTLAVRIPLWDTAYRFAPGHRLRVQVSSGAHPRFARNLGGGEPLASARTLVVARQEVFHDPARPSALVLG